MFHNYTVQDVSCTLAIIPVFAIFLFAPGYCLGWASDLLEFRRKSVAEQFLLSLPFSLVVSTVVANLVGRYVSQAILLPLFLLAATIVLAHLIYRWWKEPTSRAPLHPATIVVLVFAVLWALVVVASLADIQVGDGLYVNAAIWDHAVRVAFLDSALRSGPPTTNPFSYLGHAPTARYYYYWYVLCAYPARLTHIGARYVLYGSSVWAGFCLAALIPVYLKQFFGIAADLRRKSACGILLLAVTGLDIIPTIYWFLHPGVVAADMEWWDPVQVTAWSDALIWVPHHVAALTACFTGLLVLWSMRTRPDRPAPSLRTQTSGSIFAALAFAAAAGLSVYVTFAFAIFLVCWTIRLLVKRSLREFVQWFSAGCLTIVVSLPYLYDLLSSSTGATAASGNAQGAHFPIEFAFRQLPHSLRMFSPSRNLLLYPLGLIGVYVLEFGFFAVVAWVRFKQDTRNRSGIGEAEIASWYLVGVSIFVITFVRSSVISTNDLAFRSAMIAQFIFLLWAAEYIDRWLFVSPRMTAAAFRGRNAIVLGTFILGCVGTIYSLAILRTYTILDEHGWIKYQVDWLPPRANIGKDLFRTRQAYGELSWMIPVGSIVQYNPMSPDYIPLLMYSRYQSVDAFPNCGTEFGGDESKCPPAQDAIAKLFNSSIDPKIEDFCKKLSINVLVARESDPAWQNRASWVWNNRPIVENSYIRMFKCH